MVQLIQFEEDTTAKSGDVNFNFTALNNAITTADTTIATLSSALSSLSSQVATLSSQLSGLYGLKTGTIIMWGSSTIPDGYLLCNGWAYNISDFEALFNAIGTTYGGDGINTFCVPNCLGRYPKASATPGILGNPIIGNHTHDYSVSVSNAHTGTASYYPLPGIICDGVNTWNETRTSGGVNGYGGGDNEPYNITTVFCIKT